MVRSSWSVDLARRSFSCQAANCMSRRDQESLFKKAGALVVEKIFVPVVLYQFGNDHHNIAVGILLRDIRSPVRRGGLFQKDHL